MYTRDLFVVQLPEEQKSVFYFPPLKKFEFKLGNLFVAENIE